MNLGVDDWHCEGLPLGLDAKPWDRGVKAVGLRG
jgi:hypothetical protein